jgi:putative transposase
MLRNLSLTEVLEKQIHSALKSKIRNSTQPGTVFNIFQNEVNAFLTDVINQKLINEQNTLLGRLPYQRTQDKKHRNGFKLVKLKGVFSSFFVKKPVLRTKTLPSKLLVMLSNFGKGLIASLASKFWLKGTSTRAVAAQLNSTFGTNVNASDISKFTKELLPDINAWLSRPITENIAYLFLDAIYLPVRKPGFTSKQALLVALGITQEGKRHILGFLLGARENVDSWSALLNDLLNRGLNRSSLLLTVSDDHKAIASAVEQLLGVEHQLCIIHKMRNALSRVSSKHRNEFYADFTAAFWAPSKDIALINLGKLQAKWMPIYPKAAQIASANPDSFLKFFSQPKHFWTVLRSTNIIERFNRELRRRLRPAGAMHSEDELWKLVWSVSSDQQARWEKRKLHVVKDRTVAA